MNIRPYLLASVSILLWGAAPAVSKLALGSLSGTQLLFASSAVAALFLFAVCRATGRLSLLKTLRPRTLAALAGIGILGTFLYYEAYYAGLRTLSAQQATVINYLWPIFTVVLSARLTHERLSHKGQVALALSFLGVAIVATGGEASSLLGMDLRGVLFSLAGAVLYALFTSLSVRVKADTLVALLVYYMTSAAASGAALTATGDGFLPDRSEVLVILWTGLLAYGLAYFTWMWALKEGSTAKLSNLAYLTPVVSLFLIWLFLGEPVAPASFAGLSVILFGVMLQSVPLHIHRSRRALRSAH